MFLLYFVVSLFLIFVPFNRPIIPTVEAQQIFVVPAATPAAATSTPAFIPNDNLLQCNCWLEVRSIIPTLPNMKYLVPNSPARPGAVALYNFNGVPHYAYVESVVNDGVYGHWEKGSNLKRCQFYERFVTEDNPHLVGYWYGGN